MSAIDGFNVKTVKDDGTENLIGQLDWSNYKYVDIDAIAFQKI
jgi:hypothetical protein